MEAFVQAFAILGFIPSDDDTVEPGFEKRIAIFRCGLGKGRRRMRLGNCLTVNG